MTVLIGYLPNAEGDAAFSAALTEASGRNEDLVLLNSPRDGAFVSAEKAAPERIGNLIAEAEAAVWSWMSGSLPTPTTPPNFSSIWPEKSTPPSSSSG